MKKLSIRPLVATACVVLSLGVAALSPTLGLAQEQSDGKRKLLNRVPAVYPELARKMRITGIVKVEVVVAPSGKLKVMQVVGGNPLLAKSAVEAIEQWRWGPAPQETRELIELNFHP